MYDSFDENKYFSPLLTDREFAEKKEGLTPAECKRLLSSEKKKGDFNEKIFRFYLEERKMMRKIIEKERMISVNNDVIRGIRRQMSGYPEDSNEYCKGSIDIQNLVNANWDLHKNIHDDRERLYSKRDSFDRMAIYVHMDVELTQYKLEKKRIANSQKEDKQKSRIFWKKMNSLPYDMIKHIGGYLSYETRIDVLENTFKQSDLSKSIKDTDQTKSVITQIYNKINNRCSDWKIQIKMEQIFLEFIHHRRFLVCDHPTKKLNQSLEYAFMLFRNQECLPEYYELYRDLVKNQKRQIKNEKQK
jgi:hypothetical protein